MILKIDPQAVKLARFLNQGETDGQVRYYYLLGDAIVVCRKLPLSAYMNRNVDAQVGWDTAMPGFCADEDIGTKRTKVTIYRSVSIEQEAQTLSQRVKDSPGG